VEGYGEGSRQYRRLPMPSQEDMRVRVFRERDIPMQVALGNYDLGVASLSWLLEMQVRFPEQPIVPLADLGLGVNRVFAAASADVCRSLDDMARLPVVRLASDLPNITESFARAARLRRYRVQAVWGAAEAYPPEDADVVVVAAPDEDALRLHGLEPLFCLLDNSAWLFANADSLASRRLSSIIRPLVEAGRPTPDARLRMPPPVRPGPVNGARPQRGNIRLAVPDGHQQRHVFEALTAAGLQLEGYEEKTCVRRPKSGIHGLEVKVIRPQDMPQLVGLGEFDLAITGRDLLNEHLFAFPSSPAVELIDLQRAQYNLSAVVDGDLPADNLDEAVGHWKAQGKKMLTVAAEFPATADHYARSRHFWRYQVVPIAGASEGFVPEDADILIEGTETGKTIAENNLKIIDTLYRSTTCLIGRRDLAFDSHQGEVYRHVLERLATAGEAAAV
jgi:ATP phosphoribosyltransferase